MEIVRADTMSFEAEDVFDNFLLYVADSEAIELAVIHEEKLVITYYGGLMTTYSFLEVEARLAEFIDFMNNR